MLSSLPLDLFWLGRPRAIASALLRDADFSALIDPGPASTIHTLRENLASQGLSISHLHAIFLTHIHLDHAGATGELVRENPSLRVFVHSRGAPHMADPTQLLSSAGRLYGQEMDRLFGTFLPVPAENLHVLHGGESIPCGSGELRVLYTPGHASHHVTYFDPASAIAFVGDTAGLCVEGHPFVLPATPPPDIQIELWDASLDAISQLQARRLFLTHFGFSDNPQRHLATYRKRLHDWSDLTAKILSADLGESESLKAFLDEVTREASSFLTPEEIQQHGMMGAPQLSWLGLVRYHRKRATAASAPR